MEILTKIRYYQLTVSSDFNAKTLLQVIAYNWILRKVNTIKFAN